MKTCWFLQLTFNETENTLVFWNEDEAMAFYEKAKKNPSNKITLFMAAHEDGTNDLIDLGDGD